MKEQIPYNAGDYLQNKQNNNLKYVVLGHVWWPIEKTNAYHMLRVDDFGEPKENCNPEYLWDARSQHPSIFTAFTPKEKAA